VFYLLHWTEYFLRSKPVLSKSNFHAFYGSRRNTTPLTIARHLSLSWDRSIQSIPSTSYFLKIHLNIILSSTPGCSKWPRSLRFSHQNPEYTSPLTHTRYMYRPSHSSRAECVLQNNIFEGVTNHKGSVGHILCARLSLKVLYNSLTIVQIRPEIPSYTIINRLPS